MMLDYHCLNERLAVVFSDAIPRWEGIRRYMSQAALNWHLSDCEKVCMPLIRLMDESSFYYDDAVCELRKHLKVAPCEPSSLYEIAFCALINCELLSDANEDSIHATMSQLLGGFSLEGLLFLQQAIESDCQGVNPIALMRAAIVEQTSLTLNTGDVTCVKINWHQGNWWQGARAKWELPCGFSLLIQSLIGQGR